MRWLPLIELAFENRITSAPEGIACCGLAAKKGLNGEFRGIHLPHEHPIVVAQRLAATALATSKRRKVVDGDRVTELCCEIDEVRGRLTTAISESRNNLLAGLNNGG